MHSPLAMKLLLEGLFAALTLVVMLMSMLALANYHEQRTVEMRLPAHQSFAVVASEDGGSYQLVEWDASCEALGILSESDIVVETNFSAFAAAVCGVHIRPFLATTRHPGVKPPQVRRAEPSPEKLPSGPLDE